MKQEWRRIGAKGLGMVCNGLRQFSRFVYAVGIQSIRIFRRFKIRCSRFFRPVTSLIKRIYKATLGKQLDRIRKEVHSIRNGFSMAWKRIRETRSKGKLKRIGVYFWIAGKGLIRHKKLVGLLFNIAAPVAALILLAHTVQYWNSLEYGLTLSYGNAQIATIENEQVFEKATEMVTERMVHNGGSEEEISLSLTPVFSLKVMESGEYMDAAEVCDLLIRQSGGIIEEATGLYMNDELIGAVRSSADLNHLLSSILDEALGEQEGEASFVEKIETVTGLFPTSMVMTVEDMSTLLRATDQEEAVYVVQTGDTPSTVAANNGLTLDELNQLNGGDVESLMYPGEELVLQVAVPKLSVQITKTETYTETIPFQTVTQKDDSQYTDYSKVTQEGVNGSQTKTDKVTYVNGIETGRENVSTEITQEAVDKVVVTGTKKRPQYSGSGVSSGQFLWPTPSLKTITTYYEYRWGSFHPALDISGSSAYGKSILASDGGTVVSAGWDYTGYGYKIIIDHGNGYKTLYAHCSQLLVSYGAKVSKGQVIAKVGSTGNSTGPHLHFEIIRNGVKLNPLNYVSR